MSTKPQRTPPPFFWARQFGPQRTVAQVVFDAAFGIVVPLICLYFDPIVFRGNGGDALLGQYATVGYVATGLGMLSLSIWLLFRRLPALFAGLLIGGAIFATLLGIVLLPFSVIGLVVLIGVLGFSPLVTAFVFWRNAIRAARAAAPRGGQVGPAVRATVGLVVTCAVPWASHWYVSHELSRGTTMVLSADPDAVSQGVVVLKRVRPLADFDRLVVAYLEEEDTARRERLATAYREVTGTEIELRVARRRD